MIPFRLIFVVDLFFSAQQIIVISIKNINTSLQVNISGFGIPWNQYNIRKVAYEKTTFE